MTMNPNEGVSTMEITAQDIETFHVTDDALDIGRGVTVHVNGHVFRGPDGWQFVRPNEPRSHYYGNPSVHRVGDSKEPTAVMRQHVRDAMVAAVEAHVAEHPAALKDAQRARSTQLAHERRILAQRLREQADLLEVEATALLAGGREVHREHKYSSGWRENVRHVETADGTLLPSLPEVTVSHAHERGPAMPRD